ncbi:MAG: nuclear transport factor 2 family protein [Chitinophagaceae bacterium]|jgi:ketosteroid isomerase-like protein|nr:nuclear transport factor 2 family protein [Chitinophagaceae bacterium]MBP6046795.1 nuclear transport factor 2 family protein [Ferruginibacter sp.]NMD28934.1 nuclear transport factor 2 family protein [Bacteroidota bacterium]MBK7087740.1 nuclear transport factor 2 family protein [Chitinophagaceae bacterium]MBK7735577.1 nuclear transport factor 2 family protein [Chitinophagaceae bacterium]
MDALTNENLITGFYTAFQRLDAGGMNNSYSSDIVFFDPVFELLKAGEVKSMWQMLCANAQDFSLTFSDITNKGDGYYTCNWTATYTFSKTGKKVVNHVKAYMKIENGKIIEHSDGFSMHKWASQALGFSGKLFGWNRFFQRKIKNNARKTLLAYMQKNAI